MGDQQQGPWAKQKTRDTEPTEQRSVFLDLEEQSEPESQEAAGWDLTAAK